MIHQDSSSTTTSLFCVAWEEWDPTWHLFGDNNREALALISTDPFYDLFGVRQEGVEPADLIKACETIVLARQDRTKNPKKRPREKCTMANFQARIQDLRRKRSSLDSAVDSLRSTLEACRRALPPSRRMHPRIKWKKTSQGCLFIWQMPVQ